MCLWPTKTLIPWDVPQSPWQGHLSISVHCSVVLSGIQAARSASQTEKPCSVKQEAEWVPSRVLACSEQMPPSKLAPPPAFPLNPAFAYISLHEPPTPPPDPEAFAGTEARIHSK